MILDRDYIILPVAAMVLLVALVSFRFLYLSILASRSQDSAPGKNVLAMNNVSNLFEMPVLFYVLVMFVYASDSVDVFYLSAGWFYVLLRYAHSFIHTTYNHVPHRMKVFLLSNMVILVMWSRLMLQVFDRI